MEKVTIKTLVLAAAILSPTLVATAAETGSIKNINQLSADQIRNTLRAFNGTVGKPSGKTKKPVITLK